MDSPPITPTPTRTSNSNHRSPSTMPVLRTPRATSMTNSAATDQRRRHHHQTKQPGYDEEEDDDGDDGDDENEENKSRRKPKPKVIAKAKAKAKAKKSKNKGGNKTVAKADRTSTSTLPTDSSFGPSSNPSSNSSKCPLRPLWDAQQGKCWLKRTNLGTWLALVTLFLLLICFVLVPALLMWHVALAVGRIADLACGVCKALRPK